MRNKVQAISVAVFCLYASVAISSTVVVEGLEAKKMYDAAKDTAQILVQKNKVFILRHEGKEEDRPEEVEVKAGEFFFIVNEEDKFIHNVYDMDDESWILKKQEPSGIAAIKFDEAGRHAIRCAIHPTMKTVLKVETE
jgi:plastocyanin